MKRLYDPRDGSEVNCGTKVAVKLDGEWIAARYEIGSRGIGYFVIDTGCINLDRPDEICFPMPGQNVNAST